jgi:hypothetical protein
LAELILPTPKKRGRKPLTNADRDKLEESMTEAKSLFKAEDENEVIEKVAKLVAAEMVPTMTASGKKRRDYGVDGRLIELRQTTEQLKKRYKQQIYRRRRVKKLLS